MNQANWSWDVTNPFDSGGSGDVAKMFRNEGIKAPGLFRVDAPPDRASLLAREVIQNSWDAANELRALQESLGAEVPPFKISFDFADISGDRLRQLVQVADVEGLQDHYAEVGGAEERRALGLASDRILTRKKNSKQPLRVLQISESGTTGMYGPFEGAKSKMYLALISLGYTMKGVGSGGSYGYGKAGLIAGSATRTVFAYSCFKPQDDDLADGVHVTRRLLGMTYWGQHTISSASFTGFGRLGDQVPSGVQPLVNEDADALAEQLGMKLRSSDNLSDLGTSFLLLDPVVEPEDLKNAIERNWWAAIVEGRFTPIISDRRDGEDPQRLIPRPKSNPAVSSFVRAYEVATTPQDNDVAHEFAADLGRLPAKLDNRRIGKLGLVADLEGWSYAADVVDPDEEARVDHSTLVALVRSPLMTVQYFVPRGTRRPPYVRGIFIADDEVDDLLRQTEPKAHDAWMNKVDELGDDVDPTAPKVAEEVLKAVASHTRKYQQRLKPPPPDASNIRLTVLADLFKGLARGEAGVPPLPPPSGDRDVSIGIQAVSEPDQTETRQRIAGTARIKLSDQYTDSDIAEIKVRVNYRFMEDERAGEICPLTFDNAPEPPDEDGWITLIASREPTELQFNSEYYDLDWTGRLAVSAEVIRPVESTEI